MKIDVIYNKSSQRMTELPDECIDMTMTSPPYWGLRDYGEDVKEIWGGDPDCKHEFKNYVRPAGGGHPNPDKAQVGTTKKDVQRVYGAKAAFCRKCGAWHGQLGLEPTFQLYLDHMMIVCAEIKRVLKKTGSFWLNMGDTYSGSGKGYGSVDPKYVSQHSVRNEMRPQQFEVNLPSKCLLGIPWRLVLRLVDEQGWILRNAGIWNKPNSMPSSTKDRLSNSYEFLFHFVKNTKPQYYWNEKTGLMADRKPPKAKYFRDRLIQQKEGIDWEWRECPKCGGTGKVEEKECPRCKGTGKIKHSFWHSLGYWYDLDAIREPHKDIQDYQRHAPFNYRVREAKKGHFGIIGVKSTEEEMARYDRKGIRVPGQTPQGIHRKRHSGYYGPNGEYLVSPLGKNPGDVWTIPTQPRPEAHFATFPDKLCIKPILATCPAEICKKCGKARVRIVRTINPRPDGGTRNVGDRKDGYTTKLPPNPYAEKETIGWTDCGCNAGWDSGVLLDPFGGRGTAPAMAKKMSRHYIVYELKKEYCEKLIKPALEEIDPLFYYKKPGGVASAL